MFSIVERVQKIIVDKLGVDVFEVILEVSFMNDLGVDLLDMVELIMEFEKEFEIVIFDEKVENIQIVGYVIEYFVGELEKG